MVNTAKNFALTLLLAVFVSGCDILDVVDIDFTSDEQSAQFIVEPATSGEYAIVTDDVVTDIKQQIEDNGGSIDDLETVTISDITIDLVSGASNLNAFESFEVTIKTDGSDARKIAWKENISTGVTSINPDFTNDNLKDFIGEDSYSITLKGLLREDITSPVTLKVSAHYNVTL